MATKRATRAPLDVRAMITLLSKKPGMTQAILAKQFSVSDRTIRRWKNEDVKPRDGVVTRSIRKLARTEVRRLTRHAERAGVPLPPIDVPPIVARVQRRDPLDIKQRIDSDTVSYDVRGLSDEDVFELLQWLRDENAAIRIVYRVPVGEKEYVRGGQKVGKSVRSGTMWERDFRVFTDVEIRRYLAELEAYQLLFVMAIPRNRL